MTENRTNASFATFCIHIQSSIIVLREKRMCVFFSAVDLLQFFSCTTKLILYHQAALSSSFYLGRSGRIQIRCKLWNQTTFSQNRQVYKEHRKFHSAGVPPLASLDTTCIILFNTLLIKLAAHFLSWHPYRLFGWRQRTKLTWAPRIKRWCWCCLSLPTAGIHLTWWNFGLLWLLFIKLFLFYVNSPAWSPCLSHSLSQNVTNKSVLVWEPILFSKSSLSLMNEEFWLVLFNSLWPLWVCLAAF